jgi:hypothetical protein
MTIFVQRPGWNPEFTRISGLPVCDVTTHGGFFRRLSPMVLGPVPLYAGMWSRTMENAWQYAKVYPQHRYDGYWPWARVGWDNPRGVRYPMGKGAKPLHSLWAGTEMDYIAARRQIYIPLYAQAVRMHQLPLFLGLRDLARQHGGLVITDFDAYDHHAMGWSWEQVITCETRKMGHGFVLAMMLEGVL